MEFLGWVGRLGQTSTKSICEEMECCKGQQIDADTVHFLQERGVDKAFLERVIRSKLVEFLAVYGAPAGVSVQKVRRPGASPQGGGGAARTAEPSILGAGLGFSCPVSVVPRALLVEQTADLRLNLCLRSHSGTKRWPIHQLGAVHAGLDPREFGGLQLPAGIDDGLCAHLRFAVGVRRSGLRLAFASPQQRNDFVFGLRALQLHPGLGGVTGLPHSEGAFSAVDSRDRSSNGSSALWPFAAPW